MSYNASREFVENVKSVPRALGELLPRWRPQSDRERSQATFHNFFFHILGARTHRHALKWSYTLGLGLVATACAVILVITGVLLMVYYKPSTELAYQSIKDIHFTVPTGRFIRNIHRWAAHLMVVTVLLHMARVFYTSAYKRGRALNWLFGLGLLAITLMLSFTGYLLPYDQLAYWATTIGVNIAQSFREVTDALGITQWIDLGGFMRLMLLGAAEVGQESLLRFYLLHVMVLPLVLAALLGVHFWRIRKDGGLVRPEEEDQPQPDAEYFPTTKTYGLMAVVRGQRPTVGLAVEKTVPSWPHAFYAGAAVFMVTVAITLILGYHFDAPLKEAANPTRPENPAKAPWYFLGLQELVSYSAFMGGVGIPTIVLVGLGLIPFLDRETGGVGRWLGGPDGVSGKRVALESLLFGLVSVLGILAFTVTFGWLRNWFPDIPQAVIILFNPGTLIVALFAGWSLFQLKVRNSVRLAAIALFTCFMVGFVLMTVMGYHFRGPNWDFYWSPAQWPTH